MNSWLQPPKSVRFGLFEADFATGELRKNGRRVKLQEQPFQVLALLVQRAGQVVPREELQKALWPADTFVEFDQGVNTAIKKIRQALGDSAENPRFIETLPRKGYRFIAPVAGLEAVVPTAPLPPVPPVRSHRRPVSVWILAFSAAILIGAAAALIIDRRNTPEAISGTPVPLTTYPGEERQASLSPDGNQVAFAWNGEKQDNFDIYVKLIGSETLLRITTNLAPEFSPAWSPDGRSIAFLRILSPSRTGVFLIPAVGGAERKLTEIDCCEIATDGNLVWSPDGKWLATTDRSSSKERRSVFLLAPEDGEKRRLTSPPPGWLDDRTPAFSPDGRQLALVRQRNYAANELFVLSLSRDGHPDREPVQVTFSKGYIGAPAWSSDGAQIIFPWYGGESNSWLWRLHLPAGGTPERLAFLGDHSFDPAIARRQGNLVYSRSLGGANTWQLELPVRGGKAGPPTRVLSSTRLDFNAQYSPDGRRITFHSTRSGWSEIWICDRDGSNARQLTFLQATGTGSPRWSPDGSRIVFDSNVEGQFQLYTIGPDGGKPRRLTTIPADNGVGSWSRDGKSIYFTSNRSGEWQVWKMPAQGGSAVSITRHGGVAAFESPDARFVYYSKGRNETSLWRVPVGGGEEQQVLESIWWLNFVVVPNGIFFRSGHPDGPWPIQFFSFQTGATKVVAPIQGSPSPGLSVSSDGRCVLYSQSEQLSSELMLVENFR
jgi:Tol biopolymer transport system component/DNA-binding winged helix-turn-helix (wHTH) protein